MDGDVAIRRHVHVAVKGDVAYRVDRGAMPEPMWAGKRMAGEAEQKRREREPK